MIYVLFGTLGYIKASTEIPRLRHGFSLIAKKVLPQASDRFFYEYSDSLFAFKEGLPLLGFVIPFHLLSQLADCDGNRQRRGVGYGKSYKTRSLDHVSYASQSCNCDRRQDSRVPLISLGPSQTVSKPAVRHSIHMVQQPNFQSTTTRGLKSTLKKRFPSLDNTMQVRYYSLPR